MLDGEKNLNDLLFFAQSLIKDIELKKQEIAQQKPEDQSPSRPASQGLTSLKEERDKALRYKEWKKNFCEEGSARNRLARSVDRLNEVEAEWTNQKKVYQYKAMNMSLFSEIQLFTEQESPQKKSPRYRSMRASRWDDKSSPRKNSYNSMNPMQKSYYSRSSSQDCIDKESVSKQNAGAKEVKNSKPFIPRKGSVGTPKNSTPMAKASSYQSLNSSRIKNQERNSQSPSQKNLLKKTETPVSKSKTIFGDSSPTKKDYLKRKSYSIQRKSSIEAGNPSASTNFSSTINSARQPSESPQTMDNKMESLFTAGKVDETKRGRQASPKRGAPLTNAVESPVVPIVSKINLSDWTKHSTEIKEKSHRGQKESQQADSSMWNSEKLVLSLKVRSSLGDTQSRQPNLTSLKELFPTDSKSSARISTNTNTENSPIKSSKKAYLSPRQGKSLMTEEIIGEGSASPPSKFAKYSILKEKIQLNDSRDLNNSRQLNNSENKRSLRSSSCHQEKDCSISARNRNKSPASSRDKIASLQVQEEDLKLLDSNGSIEKWKKSREGNKEISCEVIDLRSEKEKLYKDILDKLHSQKQKGKVSERSISDSENIIAANMKCF